MKILCRCVGNLVTPVASVSHGLSPHAEVSGFCVVLVQELESPDCSRAVRVKAAGTGTSAAADQRAFTYGLLPRTPVRSRARAHLDDQAETMLLQLLRGAGVRGLAAMQEIARRSLSLNVPVVRPLLAVPRAAILAIRRPLAPAVDRDESTRC